MSDPIPRTEAGKSLLRWSESDGVVASAEDIVAIEEQAATEARRELLAKVEGLPRYALLPSIVALPSIGQDADGPLLSRAVVLALLAPSEKGARG